MSSELDLLQSQIEEKDAIVDALTARLERAAEQLDRLHRLGVDRALINCATTPAPPLPPKKSNSKQEPIQEDLHRLIEQWDALQANNSFGRIEVQIGEVRDLIVHLSQTVREQQLMVPTMPVVVEPAITPQVQPSVSNESTETHPDFENGNVEIPDNLFQEEVSQQNPAEKFALDGDLSNWDSIKQSLMSGTGEVPPQASSPSMAGNDPAVPVEPQPSSISGDSASKEAAILQQMAALIPEGLKDIDLQNASHNEIAHALEERDEYISRLLNYITSVHKLDMNWEVIAQSPQAMQETLMSLQTQLETKLRLAEVSIAVERAKLGRDEMRIRQLEANAERILKRLGVDPSDPNSMNRGGQIEKPNGDPNLVGGADPAAGGNWRRLLGLGKEDEQG
ncbi:hypothetical protein Pla110_35770 [Polystyrenella longa]|uniref:Uncharacterized protein n=1 Tax=Polystyrenella longa TaxID=2528007 RepID=A0A518CRG7_9PLAN|nr:hypothetical protein [Polystyrenella longa]QDU81826.1 hypothetical protein Pla110_35770 [Polystyrenella longa]